MRPNACLASRAISILASRVPLAIADSGALAAASASAPDRSPAPSAAAALFAAAAPFACAASPPPVAGGSSGSGRCPMTVISSRSIRISGVPSNQPSGNRPVSQPRICSGGLAASPCFWVLM